VTDVCGFLGKFIAGAVHLYHKRPNLDRLAKEMAARMKDVEAADKAAPPRLEYAKVAPATVPVTPKVAPVAVKATVQRRPPGRGNFATRWR